jgi:hypothetical protein
VGLYTLNPVDPLLLESAWPGFNPWIYYYEMRNWFQSLGFQIQRVPLHVGASTDCMKAGGAVGLCRLNQVDP